MPLWECGITSTGFDPADQRFKKISLEVPESPYFEAVHFNEMVVDLLIVLWEDEVAESMLCEIGSEFGFLETEKLLDTLKVGQPARFATYEEWRTFLCGDGYRRD